MRVIPFLLLITCLATACASRLPVRDGGHAAAVDPAPPTWSRAALRETVDRLRERETCFVRCAAEGEIGRGEVEEELERHEVGVFVGYTFERGEGGATVGLDYTYWLSKRFGVGPFVDLVWGDVDAMAAGAGVWVRPFCQLEDLAFYVAPGIDLAKEEEEEEGEEGGTKSKWEAEALLRLGVTYGVDLWRGFRLAPSFYADIIFPSKQAFVLGVTFGKEF